MVKLDECDKMLMSEDGDFEVSEALNAAKFALASDYNDRVADLFFKVIDVVICVEDGVVELSVCCGYVMVFVVQCKFVDVVSTFEAYFSRFSVLNQREGDFVVYGLFGDVYIDFGVFDKVGVVYDVCINVMDDQFFCLFLCSFFQLMFRQSCELKKILSLFI